jgi:endo-1,3(4)-beta-glucanase
MKLCVLATLTFPLQAPKILAAPLPNTVDCNPPHSITDFVSEAPYTNTSFRLETVGTFTGAQLVVESLLQTSSSQPPSILQPASVSQLASISKLSNTTNAIRILKSASISESQISSEGDTLGLVFTTLRTNEALKSPLIINHIPGPTPWIATPAHLSSIECRAPPTEMASANIFQPLATKALPSVIGTRPDHPVPRLGVQYQSSPLSTNKFYANFFLGSQTAGTWTHPYSVAWAKGSGSSQSWGMSVMHVDAKQRVYGPNASANPVGYFFNPIGIQSLVLSAAEFGPLTTLTTDSLTAFSVNVNLLPKAGAPPAVTFPLVQGMGFVTGVYGGVTPLIQTGVFFRKITRSPKSPKAGVTKYTILLEDGKTWLLYAYSPDGAAFQLTVVNNGLAQATSNWNGIIQIAKNPGGAAEALFDAACGAYATTVSLSGSVNGAVGTYNFAFSKAGHTNTILAMFALPHHIQSFSATTLAEVSTVQLQTTTKGVATAVIADSWTLVEPNMPIGMGFAPWSPSSGSRSNIGHDTAAAILNVAASEVTQNMAQQTNLNSFYYSGKVCVSPA